MSRGAVDVVPAGFVYREDFISAAQERELLQRLAEVEFSEVLFHGYPAKRTVAHFGVDYEYDSGRVTATATMPEWLVQLREACAGLAGIEPYIPAVKELRHSITFRSLRA
jgi:DNA oxidative demethylase